MPWVGHALAVEPHIFLVPAPPAASNAIIDIHTYIIKGGMTHSLDRS
eukprot:COSAG05_NODE_18758_length_303_cov_1.009804_1_plen_46_part_10